MKLINIEGQILEEKLSKDQIRSKLLEEGIIPTESLIQGWYKIVNGCNHFPFKPPK